MTGFKKYFENNAKQWILDGYNDDGYNYPTALHRARIVSKFISGLNKKKLEIIDLGCGGGDVTFYLVQNNSSFSITGVDQSEKMLELAEERREKLPPKIKDRVQFLHQPIEKINLNKKFDIVIAMGLIGYLKNDKIIFDIANNLLKPGGYFLVSCRNRLFNMKSITFRTKKEIKNKEAIKLINELEGLYSKIPLKDAVNFIRRLKKIAEVLPEKTSFDKKSMLPPSEKYSSPARVLRSSEARQSTPKQVKETASKCGFGHRAYYGVHPHLMDSNLNKMLPSQIFNKLAGCLETLEHLPISLTWSSVFIGVFQKYGKK